MIDFLDRMREASRDRVREARQGLSETELLKRIEDLPSSRTPKSSGLGFDVIAEVKMATPANGTLSDRSDDSFVSTLVEHYEAGGAFVVSVLTEPTQFNGSLRHLEIASGAGSLPVMRKDFLTDPFQVLEARCFRADGILLILKLLGDSQLDEMISAARDLDMFVLLEAFDAADIDRGSRRLGQLGPKDMIGINCRDLTTLRVQTDRLRELTNRLPAGITAVAESGVTTPLVAGALAALGYDAALVGTALMKSNDPQWLLSRMLDTARSTNDR